MIFSRVLELPDVFLTTTQEPAQKAKLQIDPLRNEKYFLGVRYSPQNYFVSDLLECSPNYWNSIQHHPPLPYAEPLPPSSQCPHQVDDQRVVPCLVFKCAGFVITRAGTEAVRSCT
jgi:hypothetical protein